MKETKSRRSFLKTAGALMGAGALPTILPSRALGRGGEISPGNRINLALIGTGGMGALDMQNFMSLPECQFVAVCDVDRERRERFQKIVNNHYTGVTGGTYRGCEAYNDFEAVIARDDIDAVVIATPDHWHALLAIEAMKAGKDVYGEKPLTRTVDEGKKVVAAVRRYGRVFQTGTQSRSNRTVRHVVELVRNGRIGELKKVRMALPMAGGNMPQPIEPVPEYFDYDRWLGPAPWAPYTKMRCHNSFRLVRDYSGGMITDHGVHRCDIALWAANKSHTGPVHFEGEGTFPSEGLFNAVCMFNARWRFEDGLEMEMYDEPDSLKWIVRFEGSEGWIDLPMEAPLPHLPVTASDPRVLHSVIKPHEDRVYASDNHWQNFLDCVKTRRDPIASVVCGHRATSNCLISEIAMDLGRPLQWDPVAEQFVNDPDANAMLTRTMREPWNIL